MQLTFRREVLASALQAVAGVVPARTPKDILKNTKLVVEPGHATLMATDTEIGIRYEVPEVETASSGEALLPTARLTQILREVTSDQIYLDVSEDILEVKAGQSQFRLPVEDPREFPDVVPFNATECYSVSSSALRQAIRRVIFSADDESARYALGGILLELSPQQIVLAATDSRRLAVMETVSGTNGNLQEKQSIVVPRKAMSMLEKTLGGEESEVLIAAGDHDVMVHYGGCVIYSRLVEGRFPNFRDVLPTETPVSIELVAGPFHNVVRQSQIVTSDESRGVDFVFTEGLLTLVSRAADVGNSRIELPIEYSGAEIAIMFDPRFISDFLRVLEPETSLRIGLIGGEDPAVFMTGEDYKYVVMPLAREA
ncbi:MAG: DNA polymerase III subunit beta [Planctomycetaceae bacterium]|nr:DNA polymerase III subunit beta [Planctomycetaceae bacterium]